MQNIAFFLGRAKHSVPVPCLRSFATKAEPGRLRELSSPRQALYKTIHVVRKRSNYLGWEALAQFRRCPREPTTAQLEKCGVSMEEYRTWEPVFTSPTLESAISHLDTKALKIDKDDDVVYSLSSLSAGDRPPTWVILFLLFWRVHSQTDAHQAYPLAIAHLPYASPDMRPPLLILTACILGSYRIWQPLEHTVTIFNGLPIYEESWHYNLFLRTVSRLAVSKQTGQFLGRLIMDLLDSMRTRNLTLESTTYLTLLSNRYVTLELTDALRLRMINEGFTPTWAHLHAYVQIFASRGAIYNARAYRQAISEMVLDQRRQGLEPEDGVLSEDYSPSLDVVAYLRNLLETPIAHARTKTTSKWSQNRHRHVDTDLYLRDLAKVKSTGRWVSALARLSRDKALPAESLWDIFQYIRENRPPRAGDSFEAVSTTTYSVLITGLLRKLDFELARSVWDEYRSSGLPLDRRALAVGLDVLTKSGSPHEALALLEEQYQAVSKEDDQDENRRRMLQMEDHRLNVSVLNSFMNSLAHVGRPDVVFYLWDKMELLWGARPDSASLTNVLNAARQASQAFPSISGALLEFGIPNPFRTAQQNHDALVSRQTARKLALAHLDRLFKPGVKVNELWGNTVAWRRGRDLFRYILFSRFPELMDVESPAQALRKSADDIGSSPFSELKRLFRRSEAAPSAPPDVTSEEGVHQLFHSEVVFTDRVFCAYIMLLGAHQLASEIPLALAWMRALDVRPRKKTLSFALIYWGEVSMDAPLVEHWGGGMRGEYARLLLWIRDWLGEDGIPTAYELRQALDRIDRMRRGLERDGDGDEDREERP